VRDGRPRGLLALFEDYPAARVPLGGRAAEDDARARGGTGRGGEREARGGGGCRQGDDRERRQAGGENGEEGGDEAVPPAEEGAGATTQKNERSPDVAAEPTRRTATMQLSSALRGPCIAVSIRIAVFAGSHTRPITRICRGKAPRRVERNCR
jgi:hypothetical protein